VIFIDKIHPPLLEEIRKYVESIKGNCDKLNGSDNCDHLRQMKRNADTLIKIINIALRKY